MDRDQTTQQNGNGGQRGEFREAGAEQLGGVAQDIHQDIHQGIHQAIHGAAREIEGQMPQAARFVHDAAAKLEGAADALRARSVDDLMESFGRFARTQPLAFFGGAVLAGFAISRFLKSSGQTSRDQTSRDHHARGHQA